MEYYNHNSNLLNIIFLLFLQNPNFNSFYNFSEIIRKFLYIIFIYFCMNQVPPLKLCVYSDKATT